MADRSFRSRWRAMLSSARRALPVLVGLALIATATLTPGSRPMPYISPWCLLCGEIGLADAVQNIFLFVPLGLGLARSDLPRFKALGLTLLVSLTVEFLQWRAIGNRDAALGDVVMNAIGGGLGFMLGPRLRRLFVPSAASSIQLARFATLAWGAGIVATAWLLTPSLPEVPYQGEWAPRADDGSQYAGRVVSLRVDGVDVPPGDLMNWRDVRRRMVQRQSAVEADVNPGPPSSQRVVIARIAGPEIVAASIAQDGTGLVCTRSLRTTRVRLRSPRVLLPDAFPRADEEPRERAQNYRLICGLRDGAIFARRERWSAINEFRLPLTPSLGWLLLLPTSPNGSRHFRLLSALWMFLVSLPLGYWRAYRLTGPYRASTAERASIWGPLQVGVAVLVGLGVAPVLFGLAMPHWTEWAATVAGATAGLGAGALVAAHGR